jgi:hypothetical protein
MDDQPAPTPRGPTAADRATDRAERRALDDAAASALTVAALDWRDRTLAAEATERQRVLAAWRALVCAEALLPPGHPAVEHLRQAVETLDTRGHPPGHGTAPPPHSPLKSAHTPAPPRAGDAPVGDAAMPRHDYPNCSCCGRPAGAPPPVEVWSNMAEEVSCLCATCQADRSKVEQLAAYLLNHHVDAHTVLVWNDDRQGERATRDRLLTRLAAGGRGQFM